MGEECMRLFFAIMLTEEARTAVQTVQASLRDQVGNRGVSWEAPEKFHYTLKFLGDMPLDRVETVKEAGRLVSTHSSAFTLTLQALGAFPNLRRPQVLWMGAGEGVPLLTRLAESLDRELSERGFTGESRRFQAHLTLARVKTPIGEQAVAQALASQTKKLENSDEKVDKVGVITVCEFVLVDSELRPEGAVYTILETFPLTSV
jgi:2'-5' RNA ligase